MVVVVWWWVCGLVRCVASKNKTPTLRMWGKTFSNRFNPDLGRTCTVDGPKMVSNLPEDDFGVLLTGGGWFIAA